MAANPEIIEAPLTEEGLAERYRGLCANPLLANLPGKIELDLWGRIPFFARGGEIVRSNYAVDLAEMFD